MKGMDLKKKSNTEKSAVLWTPLWIPHVQTAQIDHPGCPSTLHTQHPGCSGAMCLPWVQGCQLLAGKLERQ